MQILFERGVEHGLEAAGCGEWPGSVELLEAPVVPHMGWNTVSIPAESAMFAGLGAARTGSTSCTPTPPRTGTSMTRAP